MQAGWKLALGAIVAGAVTVGEAIAATWSEPSLVVHANRPARVVAAGIAATDAVVVWEDYDIVGEGRQQTSENFKVWAASGRVGHGLGASQQLGRTAAGPAPALAVSRTGHSALAWNGDGRAVKVAVRPPGGRFGPPVTIPAETAAVSPIRVGVDDAGNVTVLWNEPGAALGTQDAVRYAMLLADGSLIAPRTLAAEESLDSWVFLAVGSGGDAVAAWSAYGGLYEQARVALRPRGGEFGPPAVFADPMADLSATGVSVDPGGRATVELRRWRPPGHQPVPSDPGSVLLAQGTAADGWAAAQFFDPNARVRTYQLAANGRGDRVAVWDTEPTYWPYQPGAARVSLAPIGQTFTTPLVEPARALLGAIEGSAFVDVPTGAAITGDGEALILWDGPVLGMQVHPVSPSGQAEPPEPLLQDACRGSAGVLAADGPPGVAIAAWQAAYSPAPGPHEVWVAYRNAGPPPRPRRPRICQLLWPSRVPGALATVASGRVDLYLRLSKPVARVNVTLRAAPSGRRGHGRLLARQQLGVRPAGYAHLSLRGAHGTRRLAPGRYRVSAQAIDADGRRSPRMSTTVRAVRRRR
jgi:hypothetical protein